MDPGCESIPRGFSARGGQSRTVRLSNVREALSPLGCAGSKAPRRPRTCHARYGRNGCLTEAGHAVRVILTGGLIMSIDETAATVSRVAVTCRAIIVWKDGRRFPLEGGATD